MAWHRGEVSSGSGSGSGDDIGIDMDDGSGVDVCPNVPDENSTTFQ